MIKHVIWILLIILIGGYFVNNYFESKSKKEAVKEAKKAEAEKIENAITTAIAKLVKSTNAVDNWENELIKSEQFRSKPLTIDFERLWIIDRPILFIGAIKDIATQDQDTYKMEVESDFYYFDTELLLTLQCSRQKIDSFLKQHPDLFKYMDSDNVAIIADINEIETKSKIIEGEAVNLKVGKGKCIDILYTGDTQLTHNK
jgi:hypothetical protein